MNKYTVLLFPALLILSSCVKDAPERKTSDIPTVYFSEKGAVIDGDFSEYRDLAGTVTAVEVKGEHNPKDAEGFFVLLTDGTTLYMYADVTDDKTQENTQKPDQGWQNDSVEIFLGTDTSSHNSYVPGDTQIRILPRSKSDMKKYDVALNEFPSTWKFDAAVVYNKKGYRIEASVPLSSLNIETLQPGQAIRCEFQVNDADEGTRDRIIHWKAPQDTPWCDPSTWSDGIVASAE